MRILIALRSVPVLPVGLRQIAYTPDHLLVGIPRNRGSSGRRLPPVARYRVSVVQRVASQCERTLRQRFRPSLLETDARPFEPDLRLLCVGESV